MINFQYARAGSVAEALSLMAGSPGAKFIAGGTNLVDLMKMDVEQPQALIDISRLPLAKVEETRRRGPAASAPSCPIRISPITRWWNSAIPVLSSALLAGASQQLRNMASSGGNLLQRTRCAYFYDLATPCNKRAPGSGCSALGGLNRMNAILGTSDSCIAVHPSDMCVALAVLEAKIQVTGPRGERVIAFADFHRLPGDEPQRDNTLAADELVTGIELPPRGFADALHLSQDPRPAVLCLRLGLRRGRPRARGRPDRGGALRPRRRRPQALAQRRGRGRAPRPAGGRRRASPRRRISSSARPRASGITASRSTWRIAPSSARSPRRPPARPSPSPTRRSREDSHGTLYRHRHIARRRHRESHRGRQIRRRVQRPRPAPWEHGRRDDRQGTHHRDRRRRGAAGRGRDRRPDP